MREIRLNNEQEVTDFGKALAKELEQGDILALVGELGTGTQNLLQVLLLPL